MTRCTLRTYLREMLEYFPAAALCAYREWGMMGLRIAIAAYPLRFAPWPQDSPIGRLRLFPEFLNFLDNFCANELRCAEVENYLKEKSNPIVVDIGINVGVTARWWLNLSTTLRVIGIDMLPEVLDFTSARIAEAGQSPRWTPILSGVGSSPGTAQLFLSDPFDGTTSLTSKSGSHTREVNISTVDLLLSSHSLPAVDLLKIDIEGFAGFALEGATDVLRQTRFVCVETHGRAETERCAEILTESGFNLFSIRARHMWWRRSIG
jgi:FkbM family methyltransferase